MKVHVLNRKQFELELKSRYADMLPIEKDEKNCYISIHNYDQIAIADDSSNYLNLWFDDITDDEDYNKKYYPSCAMFTADQAKEIIEFCSLNRDKENIFIHCFAGISRSGAVGYFANDLFGAESGLEFGARHPWLHPNPHVSRLLNKEMRECQ